jgi:hypothetical protein
MTTDSMPPVSVFLSPNSNSTFTDAIGISGSTTDANGVASTTLAYALYDGDTCGAFTTIATFINQTPEAGQPFDWSYLWTPSVEGTYCLTAHGEDIAGNTEQSPRVFNITYSTSTIITTTPTTGGSSGGTGGGNGPIAGSLGGSTGGTSGSSSVTTGTGTVGTTETGGSTGTATTNVSGFSNQLALGSNSTNHAGNTVAQHNGTVIKPGVEISTATPSASSTVSNSSNKNQTALVINSGMSWLTWAHGLWILLALLILILLILFFSRRRNQNQ